MWIVGFACNLRPCRIEEVELTTIVEGLKLAWSKGCRRILVETNFMEVKDLILSKAEGVGKMRDLLVTCKELLARPWEVFLHHVFREANG